MAKIKITEGCNVLAGDRPGIVKATYPVKTGKPGRPKTVVTVEHPDGVAEYGVGDLKVLA